MEARVRPATRNSQPRVVEVGVGAVVTWGQSREREEGRSGIVSSSVMAGVGDALAMVILPTEVGRAVEGFLVWEHSRVDQHQRALGREGGIAPGGDVGVAVGPSRMLWHSGSGRRGWGGLRGLVLSGTA